jgi:hypothetical protein|tara:strand:+ start:1523 stop:1810 length:288 start_codon:yes stop_codon:yes gene_type:complete
MDNVVIKVMLPGAQHFSTLDLPAEVMNLRTLKSHLASQGNDRVANSVVYVGDVQALDDAKAFTDYELTDNTLYVTFVNENKTGGLIRFYQELLSQ